MGQLRPYLQLGLEKWNVRALDATHDYLFRNAHACLFRSIAADCSSEDLTKATLAEALTQCNVLPADED